MFGPGVSTMPSETRAKPSREVRWGTGRTRRRNLRISSARNIAMSFRKLHREQFIRGGGALPRIFQERVRRLLSAPSPACGGGLGWGLLIVLVRATSPTLRALPSASTSPASGRGEESAHLDRR